MRYLTTPLLLAILLTSLAACGTTPAESQNTENNDNQEEEQIPADPETLRVATFNTSLYRTESGALIEDLSDPGAQQPAEIAEIIQIVRPDIILVNEFDYDEAGQAATLFLENFLNVPQGEQEAIDYPHFYVFSSNTGLITGIDLNGDGTVEADEGTEEYAQNSFGYGRFYGQYAFAVFSKYPLEVDELRTFQTFLWDDMPDNMLPYDFYSQEAVDIFRLSSKNHVDLPITVGDHRLHLLASHPTPPAFDGEEQRNVRRNHDEVRFWHDYIRPEHSAYIYDDAGEFGGIAEDAYFVIVGDLNADPHDGDSFGGIAALLDDDAVTDPMPSSEGGAHFGAIRGGANSIHQGEHQHDTALFNVAVGNLRVDYALPSSNLHVEDSAVFWPAPGQPHADIVTATDHRMVWVDITLGYVDEE